jgi:hypothetical protein
MITYAQKSLCPGRVIFFLVTPCKILPMDMIVWTKHWPLIYIYCRMFYFDNQSTVHLVLSKNFVIRQDLCFMLFISFIQ